MHGVITSFRNYAEYDRTLKFVINKVNEAKGLPKIDANTTRIHRRLQPLGHLSSVRDWEQFITWVLSFRKKRAAPALRKRGPLQPPSLALGYLLACPRGVV